jgi:hypothetical protein
MSEMLDPSFHLLRTFDVRTSNIHLPFNPADRGTATRTMDRHFERLFRAGSTPFQNLHYRWDYLTRLLDNDDISFPNVLSPNLLAIVKSRPRNRRTA